MALSQILMSAGNKAWTGSDRFLSACSSRALSITCRGKYINRDELFAYRNGPFLVNETKACNRRCVRANIDQLCSLAVQLFNTLGSMSDSDRLGLVQQMTESEGELASIRFPTNGSLYLRDSLARDET